MRAFTTTRFAHPCRLLAVLLLLVATVGCASVGPVVPTQGVVDDEIDGLVQAALTEQAIVGAAVGVVHRGEFVHLQPYGSLDRDGTEPVTLDSRFRWASVSKPLTAVAALQLVEAGELDLDTRAGDVLPYWPGDADDPDAQRKARVTVEHLLGHRGGVHHYGQGNDESPGPFAWDRTLHDDERWNAEQSVAVFAAAPLVFAPGDGFRYTTFGFNLLGAVVEEVSPAGYEAWVAAHVAGPAGMTSLRPARDDYRGYWRDDNGRVFQAREAETWYKLPGGAWSSNVADGLRFADGLLRGTFLAETTLWPAGSAADSDYHHGISHDAGRAWHSGGQAGVRSFMALRTDDGIGVVIFANSRWADLDDLAWKIADAVARR